MFVSFVSIYHNDILILYNRLIQKEWLAYIFDFGDGAFQVKCLGQYDLEDLSWSARKEKDQTSWCSDLLNIDAVASAAEYQTCSHGFRKPSCLVKD